MSGFAVRTDLALEDGERIRESGCEKGRINGRRKRT